MFSTDDTIVAIATPPGPGGLGVIRLSGSAAHDIVLALLDRRTPLRPRHATLGRVREPAGDGAVATLDQVVVTRFVAPHSFTGEDVIEVSAHGSALLLRRILELSVDAGARLAEPGEFTLRAYLNGRLDLIQAEAVGDLVSAVTPLQARAAMDQLEGTLTGAIARIDGILFDLAARLEASLDFPEEGFHFITRQDAAIALEQVATADRQQTLGVIARERPESVADALAEAVNREFGEHLDAAELEAVRKEIQRGLERAQRLRRAARLTNADPPVDRFEARPPGGPGPGERR